jgi:hypothetical protein
MAKKSDKYIFNAQTLKYEKAVVGWGKRLMNVFMFICASLVFSLIISTIVYNFFDSPKEKILRTELNGLKDQYEVLNKETDRLNAVLDGLQYRDGNIYRVLFETDPIPASVWEAGSGGVNKYKNLEKYDNGELMIDISKKVDKLKRQMAIQSVSYDEIAKLIKGKEQMIASIPSIQPIKNKDLERIASGFGVRIDPIYKVPRQHDGLDFAAPMGTEIFATGDGVVEAVDFSYGGYGNEVVINHGYGYRTRYGHMSRTKAQVGQKVKRGEVIGYVGSTGKSTGTHVHYEVIRGGIPVNPINYFFNDVTDDMYAKMVERSQTSGQSLD